MDPLERIAIALEQIALELAEQNGVPEAPYRAVGPVTRPAPPEVFPPFRGSPAPWECPIHHTSKVVPAGYSERTGKSYDAFTACAERGCNEKPPRGFNPAPQRAVPPSEGVQGRTLP